MINTRWIRTILIGGIFLVPFIPFIVLNSMFFPFITGKAFAFRILIEILFGLWLLLALNDKNYRPTWNALLISIVAFVAVIGLADILGENPFKSIWSNFERMEGLWTILHLFLYTLIAGTVLDSEKLWRRFWNTTVGASVIMAGYGILQLMGAITINQGGLRLDATLGNAIYLAVYMLFHIFITAFLLATWRGPLYGRLVYAAIILLQIVILYYTATRGAILGFLGGVLLMVLLLALFRKNAPRVRFTAVGILAGLVIAVGGFILIKDSSFVKESPILSRLALISLEEGEVRFLIWDIAWEGFKEKPLLGWGQENFNLVYNTYYTPKLQGQEPWFDRVHNIFLDWLIAGGILGLLSYLSIALFLLYSIWFSRGGREPFSFKEKSILTGLLAGYMFHNIFVFDNLISYLFYFSLIAYVYSRTRVSRDDSRSSFPCDINRANRLAMPLSIILVLGTIYFINVRGILTSASLLRALGAEQTTPGTGLPHFVKAASYDNIGSQEVAEQIIQAAAQVARSDAREDVKQAYFDLARREIEEEIIRSPGDARLRVFYASLLRNFGFPDRAREELNAALALSPMKQDLRFESALAYLAAGETEAALEEFKFAFDLAPEYGLARIFYAAALIRTGQFPEADQLLIERFGTPIVNEDYLLNANAAAGRLEVVRDIWKLKIEREPRNIQNYVSLAATYLELGEPEEAVRALEAAAAVNPSARGDLLQLIENIKRGKVELEPVR